MRDVRDRRRNGCPRIMGKLQYAVGGRNRIRGAAVPVQVRARLARRGGLVVAALRAAWIGVETGAVLMIGRMIVQAVVPMLMGIERRHGGRMRVEAAGTQEHGNHEQAQNLASRLAHTQEKPEDSQAVKPNAGHGYRRDIWRFNDLNQAERPWSGAFARPGRAWPRGGGRRLSPGSPLLSGPFL